MKKKKILCLPIIAVLMLNVSVIDNNVSAESTPTVYATDHEFYTKGDLTGTRFNVTVGIENVTDMGAWAFGLYWNTSLLEAEYIYATPDTANNTDWVPADENLTFHRDGPPAINNTIGRVLVGALCPQPLGQGLNGDFEFVKIQFRIILAPPYGFFPPANITWSCALDLNASETVIVDSYGSDIPINVEDGLYSYVRKQFTFELIPVADFTWDPQYPYVGDNVTLTDTSTPNGGYLVSWMWTVTGPATLGPNNTQNTWFTCDDVGTVSVTLTILDSEGVNDTASRLITVVARAWTGGTIYIRADGSVDPDTAPISSVDNVTYTFTDNITIDVPLTYPDGIVVERDNIIVDGTGYTIQGARARYANVISLSGRNNITIRNMEIIVHGHGIYLYKSSDCNISGNNITGKGISGCEGICLAESANNTVSGNNITNTSTGIWLAGAQNKTVCGTSDNRISGNLVTNNGCGISLVFSSNNMISGNVMNGNEINLDVYGSPLNHFMHSIDASNMADEKPVYYLVNQRNLTINPATHPEIGYLALINSTNVTVEDLTLTTTGYGILLAYTNNSLITGNNLKSNVTHSGIYLHCSSNNTISENNIATNSWGGGIALISSMHARSFNNVISGNNITNNWAGIRLEESSNNSIYHNNFVNNTHQVSFLWFPSNYFNFWDNGYPSGGNYWSDYEERYPNATEIDGSGIWDTPYVMGDANNTDNYPLVSQCPCIHAIALEDVRPSKTVLGRGFPTRIDVDIANQGHFIETSNVTVYANSTVIATVTNITLTSRNSTTITLTWNTTGFSYGNYTISAHITPVSNETYTLDNTLINGWIYVTARGDVNGDGECDVLDLKLVKLAYSGLIDDPNADIDNNGAINILDLKIEKLIYSGIL